MCKYKHQLLISLVRLGCRNNGTSPASGEDDAPLREPNTALLSTFLMFGTFYVAFQLKHLRYSNLFAPKVRLFIGQLKE